jgi:hypothetical protein
MHACALQASRYACMGTAVTVHILEKKIGGTAEAEDE